MIPGINLFSYLDDCLKEIIKDYTSANKDSVRLILPKSYPEWLTNDDEYYIIPLNRVFGIHYNTDLLGSYIKSDYFNMYLMKNLHCLIISVK